MGQAVELNEQSGTNPLRKMSCGHNLVAFATSNGRPGGTFLAGRGSGSTRTLLGACTGDDPKQLQLGFYPCLKYPYSLDSGMAPCEPLNWGKTLPRGYWPMIAKSDSDGFSRDASKYAAYLETPAGRLRSDLAFANLQDFLPWQANPYLRALDLGCGTGVTAVRLARLGIHVTLLDSSPAMLDIAKRTTEEVGVTDKVELQEGDATQLAKLFDIRSFDVIVCHNLLEYLDDPGAVLCGAVRVMRDRSAILSVLVRNQAGEVLKAALQKGDLAAADQNLTAEWGQESLYGGRVRFFTPETLEAALNDASLLINTRRGVRVIADYLPEQMFRPTEYERILAVERKLGKRREFIDVARYLHCLARRATFGSEGQD
jgi:S-adenosylmethionine-dependent methyltransferase